MPEMNAMMAEAMTDHQKLEIVIPTPKTERASQLARFMKATVRTSEKSPRLKIVSGSAKRCTMGLTHALMRAIKSEKATMAQILSPTTPNPGMMVTTIATAIASENQRPMNRAMSPLSATVVGKVQGRLNGEVSLRGTSSAIIEV